MVMYGNLSIKNKSNLPALISYLFPWILLKCKYNNYDMVWKSIIQFSRTFLPRYVLKFDKHETIK